MTGKPNRGRVSPELKERIVELADDGLSNAAIARKLGVTVHIARYHRMMAGLLPLHGKDCDDIVRNGRPVYRFRPEEDRLVEELAKQGKSKAEIGRALGERFDRPRPSNSITARLAMLAATAEREIEEAEAKLERRA